MDDMNRSRFPSVKVFFFPFTKLRFSANSVSEKNKSILVCYCFTHHEHFMRSRDLLLRMLSASIPFFITSLSRACLDLFFFQHVRDASFNTGSDPITRCHPAC